MIGYIIGTLAGIGVALLFHQKPRVAAVYMPVVTAMNAVPRIIFAPLFVLVFGYSWLGSAALVILVVLFIAFFTTYKGLASLDPVFTSWGELNGFSSWEMWRHIKFPAVVGWLTASMRTTIGISFSAAIVAEFLGMPEGLGALIQRGLLEFRPASILASLVAVALIVILIDAILRLVERTMSTWATDR
ncbi:MAG TPA: ABC transporter permease subunit [Acidimicrobiia bacterium]|nr:ABC transporter permease subunit [Acidimicrobiia bacterium]